MKEEPQLPPASIANIIAPAAERAGVPLPLAYAVAWVESRYNPLAESHAGALGLFQLMPRTAEGLGVIDRTDPVASARAGLQYLAAMFRRFGTWPAALAAYNWGPGHLGDAIDAGKSWPASVQERYIDPVLAAAAKFAGAQEPSMPEPEPPKSRRAVAVFVAALAALAAWRLSR